MIASLPMYDFPSSYGAWEAFYADWGRFMRAEGLTPPELTRGNREWEADIFVSMTCGAPFRNGLHGHLHLVATLDFEVSVLAGYYHSLIYGAPAAVTRLAVNDLGSQSGFHTAVPLLRGADIAFEIVESGSHWRSLEMVAAGEAELASIDAVSHRFILRENPGLADLPLVAVSDPTPGLPLVTSHAELVAPLRRSLMAMLADGGAADLREFGLQGAVVIERTDYMAVQNAEV